jgi:hypothetical protein
MTRRIKMTDFKFYHDELNGEECACGAWKRSMFAFCYTCHRSLPEDMKRELWKRIGDGYEEAYNEAISWLKEEGRTE